MTNFVTKVLNAGGSIHPLLIPVNMGTKGTGLFNPSVYVDKNDEILVNVRHCQYTIYHAELGRFEHQWGPLCYLCPEDDLTLTTTNYFCKMNTDLTIKKAYKVDTSKLDVKPIWEFVGLEDCRIVRWDDRLFYCGVRRDTTPNGQGRMELSEIQIDENDVARETSRFRIPSTFKDDSYCEKNWVPILDMPYHFVKWSNPTEIVRVDIKNKVTEQVFLGTHTPMPYDLRGGSQVIWFDGKYRITIAHVLTKFHKSEAGRKNAQYRHCFIVWDKDWNVVKYSKLFDFMGGEVEFCCGLAEYNGHFLVTFGFQDNAAYILGVPRSVIEEFVYG